MPEACNKERWNTFDGVADRQISGSPNNINASEGKKDQQPVLAPHAVLVRKHLRLTKLTIIAVTSYYHERRLHRKKDIRTCQRAGGYERTEVIRSGYEANRRSIVPGLCQHCGRT